MFWVNGVPQTHVELGDRSFQYGDGGFTTILTQNGELVYWQEHTERMSACLDALKSLHLTGKLCMIGQAKRFYLTHERG